MKKYLIITTALTTICFAPEIMAQCTENTDCASLGYTETSCPDGGLKCPLGNYWYCPGEAEWGKCNGLAKNCNIGDILYSNGTCSPQNISGKTPIAVVIYKSADGNCAQAMALKPIGSYPWGGFGTDISTLPNFIVPENASYDLNSCLNTEKILAAGNKSTYRAAWVAHEYKTKGTNAGDWCLPAAGIMTSIKNNMSAINAGFVLAGGDQFGTSSHLWSSSESSSGYAWGADFRYAWDADFRNDYLYSNYNKSGALNVRPVIEF